MSSPPVAPKNPFNTHQSTGRPRQEEPSAEYLAKRRSIVDAAAVVFREKGYERGSLDDVAAVLGIRKASLYHYFSSKQVLLELIFHQALSSELDRLRLLAKIEDPAHRLSALIRFQIEVVVGERDHFSVFFDHLSKRNFESSGSDEGDTMRHVRALEREYFSTFVDIIRTAIDAEVIPAIDPWYGAQAILGMTSWVYKWFDPSRHDLDTLVESYIRLIVKSND